MLYALLTASKLKIDNLNKIKEEITSARIILEPFGGGGDQQQINNTTRIVEQLKTRSSNGTWSLREIVEDVLPDLYKAIDPEQPNTQYHFITDGRIGDCKEVITFFRDLKNRNIKSNIYNDLDNNKILNFSRIPSEKSLFGNKIEYTERSLFEDIVKSIIASCKLDNKDVERINKNVFLLLSNFHVIEQFSKEQVQSEINSLLLPVIDATEDLDTIRDALLTDLARSAAIGNKEINPTSFFKEHHLNVTPISDKINILSNSNNYLGQQLDLRDYNINEDVRKKIAQNILESWKHTGKTILLISGDSGSGKSWLIYSIARKLSDDNIMVIYLEATDSLDRDIEKVADIIWQRFLGRDSRKTLHGIVNYWNASGIKQPVPLLYLFIDAVPNKLYVENITKYPWDDFGIKICFSCLPEYTRNISATIFDKYIYSFHTEGFSVSELHDYLNNHLKYQSFQIPSDILNTLHRPLLAKIYCDIAQSEQWVASSEYELYNKYWNNLSDHTLKLSCIAKLSTSLLEGTSYPWSINQLFSANIDDDTLNKLLKYGGLRKTQEGQYEIWHDRILNWAVAEGLYSDYESGIRTIQDIASEIKHILVEHRSYQNKSLGYVPMDTIWLFLHRSNNSAVDVSKIINTIETGGWYIKETLYKELLPTLGEEILPFLFNALKVAISEDNILVNEIVKSISNFNSDIIMEQAEALLNSDLYAERRAAANIFALSPTHIVLDKLWSTHCDAYQYPEKYKKTNDEVYSFIYEDFYSALKSCVKLHPDWLESVILSCDKTCPIHDLVYLLLTLDSDIGRELWLRYKEILFGKINSKKERCLAICIGQFKDKMLLSWLSDRIHVEEDILGASALKALIRINPDWGLDEMSRLSGFELYLTRHWVFSEALIRRPIKTRQKVLSMMNTDNAWDIAILYQDRENFVDVNTFSILLESLEKKIKKDLEDPSSPNEHPLWGPFEFMSKIYRWKLLQCLFQKKDSNLEKLLVRWLLRKGARSTVLVDHELEHGTNILYKMNGKGFVQIINSWLSSNSEYGIMDSLQLAIKRLDDNTVPLLCKIKCSDILHNRFPLYQSWATRILGINKHFTEYVNAINKWGIQLSTDATHVKIDTPFRDEEIDSALQLLKEDKYIHPGAILALGIGQRKDYIDLIHNILEHSENKPDISLSCIISLKFMWDDSDKGVSLIAKYLNSQRHQHAARMTLLNFYNNKALDVLISHLQENYDDLLAYNLLNYEYSFDKTIGIINDHIINIKGTCSQLETMRFFCNHARGIKISSYFRESEVYRNIIREGCYIYEKRT